MPLYTQKVYSLYLSTAAIFPLHNEAHHYPLQDKICPYHQTQGNERNIDRTEIGRLLQFCQIADVRPLEIFHSWIGAKRRVKLVMTHVNCIDECCSVLDHAVRKAACGCAAVEALQPSRVYRKHTQRLFQLESASADIGNRLAALS